MATKLKKYKTVFAVDGKPLFVTAHSVDEAHESLVDFSSKLADHPGLRVEIYGPMPAALRDFTEVEFSTPKEQ